MVALKQVILIKPVLTAIFFIASCGFIFSQDSFIENNDPLKIPVEFKPEYLQEGAKIKMSVTNSSQPVVCTGPGNQSVGGFLQCAGPANATPTTDRNAFWNFPPPGWAPSETYEYNFPPIESEFPCVAGVAVDEMIITITINSVTFDLGSPFACCADYFEGVFGNLYDDCTASPCPVAGDGLVNNGNPATGDCFANGDHLVYDVPTTSFPLGLPFTSTTTCLAGVVGTGEALGVDIVPSFFYQDAAAAGCACPSDLISQGFVTVDYSIEVEYVFCSANLPAGCFPATFDPVGPLCENDPAVVLPTTSLNGISGSWNPASIDPAGQGGNTVTAVFTPNPGPCIGGTAEIEVQVNAAATPTFDPIGPLCENDPPVPLPTVSNNGISGTWDVGSTFDPTGVGGFTSTITFTPDAAECATSATLDIVVENSASPLFSIFSGVVCESDPPYSLPSTSDNGISGSWDVGSTFDPAGLGGTITSIVFTPDVGECASTTTISIPVTADEVPTFDPIGPLCQNEAPFTLPTSSTNGIAGTWDVGPTFDPSGLGGTTATITFTPTPTFGQCATSTTLDIVVETESTPLFDPLGPICENEAPIPLPAVSTNGIAGTWDVGTTFDPSGQGGNTVTLNFTPNAGECATSTTLDITVTSEILPLFTNIGPVCENASPVPLPTISNNGISGVWDVGPTFNPFGQGGNTVTITFNPDPGVCASITTMDVIVNSPQTPSFVPIGPLCESDPPVPLQAVSLNGISGTWDVGPTFDPTGQGGNVVTITFTPTPNECADVFTMDITVNAGDMPSFAPIGPLCENENPVPLPNVSLNGINGTWDVGPFFDPAGQGGNNVLITFTPAAGQCASTFDMMITVNAEGTPTFDPIGPFCEDDAPFTLPTTSLEGAAGTWDVGANFDPSGLGGTTTDIVFTPSANECFGTATVPVVVNALPQNDIVDVSCNANLTDYFVEFTTDGDVVVSTAGTVTDNGGGSFTVDGIPEGTDIDITVTNSTTNCESTFTITSPSCSCPTIDPPVGNDVEICEGETIPNLSVTVGAGLQVDWYDAATGGTLLAQNSTTYLPTGAGTYYAEAVETSSNCTSNTRTPIELIILPIDVTMVQDSTCNMMEVGVDTTVFNTLTCDSLVITTTTLIPASETFQDATSCDPADVGLDTLTLMNQAGCDSLVIINTTLAPADTSFATDTTCDPMMVGVDTTVFATATCDSVVITTTSLDPLPPTFLQATSCNPMEVGIDTVIVQTSQNCDSLIITTTTLVSGDETFQNATSCDPTEVGVDTVILMNQVGCDSLIITTTTLSAADTTFATDTTCDPTMVGVDTTVFATATCDSIVITTISLLNGDLTELQDFSCDLSQVGLDTVILSNQAGCDSLVVTETIFQGIPPTFLQAESCDTLLVGVDSVIFNSGGCDSLVITTTTLLPNSETFLMDSSCDPANVGIDTLILPAANGCDSLIITTTSLSPADTTFATATTCDPMQVGVDTVVFNTPTCDSIVITTTTQLPSDIVFENAITCDPAQVGIDTVFLTNQFNCDSLVVTTTILDVIPPTFVQGSTCDPAEVGQDTVIFATATCDSIVITNTILLPSSSSTIELTTCIQAEVGSDTLVLVAQNGCDSLVITNTSLVGGITDADIQGLDPTCLEPFGSISIPTVTGGLEPYLYSIDGGLTLLPSTDFQQLIEGDYDVVIEDANGCTFETTISLIGELPPSISINPDQITVPLGESVNLNPVVIGQWSTVTWSPADFLDCTDCLDPVSTPLDNVSYVVTIQTATGCTASTTVSLSVDERIRVYTPDAFSPNGDGINDVFTIFGNENLIQEVEELQIFDRWGGKVFENFNFPVNDLNFGWDGMKNGEAMQLGVYVYYANLTLVNGEQVMVEGGITLIR